MQNKLQISFNFHWHAKVYILSTASVLRKACAGSKMFAPIVSFLFYFFTLENPQTRSPRTLDFREDEWCLIALEPDLVCFYKFLQNIAGKSKACFGE